MIEHSIAHNLIGLRSGTATQPQPTKSTYSLSVNSSRYFDKYSIAGFFCRNCSSSRTIFWAIKLQITWNSINICKHSTFRSATSSWIRVRTSNSNRYIRLICLGKNLFISKNKQTKMIRGIRMGWIQKALLYSSVHSLHFNCSFSRRCCHVLFFNIIQYTNKEHLKFKERKKNIQNYKESQQGVNTWFPYYVREETRLSIFPKNCDTIPLNSFIECDEFEIRHCFVFQWIRCSLCDMKFVFFEMKWLIRCDVKMSCRLSEPCKIIAKIAVHTNALIIYW